MTEGPPSLAYEVVDVFTDRPFAGNGLAVVLDGDDLTTGQMQALAREFNLSETAFPTRAPEGATYGLRIFTPEAELPFAWHPSVGAAWVLHRLGRIAAGPNTQACGAGLLPVSVDDRGATLTGGTPRAGEPLDPAPLLAAVGLDASRLGPVAPRTTGVGIDWTFLPVTAAGLAAVRPDPAALAALPSTGLSLVELAGQEVRSRVFPGGVGVPEDPATGSAALALGVFLAAAGVVGDGTHPYVVEQGREMGRPSRLTCTVEVAAGAAVRTTVGGSVVPVARGEVRLPPP